MFKRSCLSLPVLFNYSALLYTPPAIIIEIKRRCERKVAMRLSGHEPTLRCPRAKPSTFKRSFERIQKYPHLWKIIDLVEREREVKGGTIEKIPWNAREHSMFQ